MTGEMATNEPGDEKKAKKPSDKDKQEMRKKFMKRLTLSLALSTILIFIILISQIGVWKPAVYLYPEKDMQVSVKVDVNGRLTETIPEYGNGWDVQATPSGLIDGRYNYLFYEAALNRIEEPETGWIVEYDELDTWFKENLLILGLNDAEADEFRRYWTNKLPESRFYRIGLLSEDFLGRDMKLTIFPEPETEIRRIFYFKPLDEKTDLTEPEITKIERKGFTIVEWGGILDLNIIDRCLLNVRNLISR